MGVPKFYRWISERYPCLSEVVKEYQIPEFDNLYLDMNGVVHVCSHPEDDNPHFRITEEKIFSDIFHYIEVLFRMIKPRKVFFMAIDGVAPRAKMNQQRGRRFRSAREAENLVKKALEKGEILPTEARFDSNCITPGTEFMDKLHQQLQYFVVKKVSTDRMWQGVRIYLSGHETPGEGEHKVMDFIRYEKTQPGYDSNTRHCLYGLDADLIMLGLTTHEPHFSLLREEVRFGKNNQKRSNTPEETTFHLLHLSLMREYLDFEFSDLRPKLPFRYDLERIIDDWVLMGFLVGNDFIPHLPEFHIHHDALPQLWKTYKRVLPTLNGYLHDGGTLNLANFEKYLRVLSKFEVDKFGEKHADIKWLESRKREKNKPHALDSHQAGIPTANEFIQLKDDDCGYDNDFKSLQRDMEALALEYDFGDEEDDDEYFDEKVEHDDRFYQEFQKFKAEYYKEKMKYPVVNQDVLREQSHGYVLAIQWILFYYYNGVPSWSWYYPHHYAPYLSDVRDFAEMRMEFDMATPFLPFQQLMAVLPAASKNLLPKPLQTLMISEVSPVIDYYPIDFETDLNGKQQDWEAVVLIPFIDETRLISAMLPLEAKMTDEEKGRNKHGPHILFEYIAQPQGTYTSTVFPDLVNHQSRITEIPKYQFWIDPAKQMKGLQPGVKQDMYFPGFPTLKHIPHQSLLMKASVKVFQHNSRGENMVLTITRRGTGHDLEQVAHELIGQSVHVGWPHLIEARVNAVSDGETKYYGVISTSGKSKGHHNPSKVTIEHESLDSRAQGVWHKESESITEHYLGRKGVIVGDVQILVYVSPLAGRRYLCGLNGIVALEKQWSSNSMAFVYQGTVKDIAVKDPSYKEYKTLEELFYDKSEVFMLGHPHYGCMGEVLSVDPKNEGRIRVDFTILEEPDLTEVCQLRQKLSTQYYPGYNLARRLGIDSHLLSRITGCVFVTRGSRENNKGEERQNRINVGLNLKFNKSSTEVPGYTRKVETEWQYSPQLQIILEDYISTFPELFDHIGAFTNESSYFEADIFTPETEHTLQDLSKYLKQLPCAGIQPVPHGSDILDDQVVKGIQDEVKIIKERNRKKKKHIKMQVRPHLLYRPLEAQLTLVPDMSTTYCLFDRIVNVRDGFSVPLGIRGTIIGITNAEKEQDVVYDVVFDEEFMGGLTLRCSPNCGYRMPATAMINLSHGERKANGTVVAVTKPTAVVKPQSGAYSEAAARSRINNQPQRTHQQQNQRQNRYEQQPMQQRQQWSQQRQPQGHQQQEQQQQQQQQQQLHGVQGGRDQQRGNQQQQQQQQQMGFPGNKQQSQGSRQLYPNLQQFLQGNKNQRGSAHSQIQQQMQPQAPNEFADMWNQLQEGMVLNPEAGAVHIPQTYNLPPRMKNTQMRSDKMKSKESQPPQDDYKPSLEQAALALQASPVKQGPIVDHRTQQKSEPDLFDIKMEFVRDQPGGKKQNKSQKSKDSTYSVQSQPEIGGINEFAAIFQSLQDKDKAIKSQEFAPLDIQDSTAALCQMLNINQSEASNTPTAPGGQSAKEDSKPVYGKQLSVQQLFTEADHHQQQVLREQQQIREQGKTMNKPAMSSADVLAEFCLKSGLKKPVYDYQMGRENKQRGIVTLSNGQVFQGAFTRNLGHAADSAAAAALLHLNSNRGLGMPQVRPNQPPPQASSTSHQGAPPSQNTNRLSASPNSAFTPVRGPQQQSVSNPSSGPMAMSQPPPFPMWGPPPFPPPPQFGQFPTNQPPPQRFQHGNSPRGKGPRGGPMGFMPFHQGSGNYPRPHQGQLPIPGFNPNYPPPPPNQDGPPFAFHPQSMPQWERNKESWSQQQPPVKGQGVNQGQEVRAGQEKPQTNVETPKKANPFIPLQVMMKQKTPQRETSKKEDEIDSNVSCPEAEKDRNVARVLDLNARPAESVNVGTPHSEPQKNEQHVVTVNRVQNNDTSPVYQSAKTPPTSSISTQDKTSGSTPISASKQPHRPKSRIAANFGIKM